MVAVRCLKGVVPWLKVIAPLGTLNILKHNLWSHPAVSPLLSQVVKSAVELNVNMGNG